MILILITNHQENLQKNATTKSPTLLKSESLKNQWQRYHNWKFSTHVILKINKNQKARKSMANGTKLEAQYSCNPSV